MKNYLKLFVPAMFLLITTSAFAQEINIEEEYAKFEEAKGKVVASIKNICKGDAYCEDYAVLLAKTSPSMKEVNAKLTAERDYKQALYNIKYAMAKNREKGMYVEFVEFDRILNLSTFIEAQIFLTDIPLTKRGYDFAFAMLEKATDSEEKFDTIKQMVEKIYGKDPANYPISINGRGDYVYLMRNAINEFKINQCPENFNVKNYYKDDKMCFILNWFSPIYSPLDEKIKELSKKQRDAIEDQYYKKIIELKLINESKQVKPEVYYTLEHFKNEGISNEQIEKMKEYLQSNPEIEPSKKDSLMKH